MSRPEGYGCQKCDGPTTVTDSRKSANAIRRRRACILCGHRFTTYEYDITNRRAIFASDPIVAEVQQLFSERSARGQVKYGKTLDRDDLSLVEWLSHLQEELMDAVNYLQAAKHRINQNAD